VARDLLGQASAGSEADWRLLAGSGWLGLEVPGALDGDDATFAETAVILTELGRAASSGPPTAGTWPSVTARASMVRSGHRARKPGGHRPSRR
jgi:alkylation response protein AidB-like acyl-CoA dehydrogenase